MKKREEPTVVFDLSKKQPKLLDSISNKDLYELLEIIDSHLEKKSAKTDTCCKDLIPLTVFSTEISPATALVKYLKDTKNKTYSDIAKELNRNERTIWTLYNKAKKKLRVEQSKYLIPLQIFENRSLSILENLVSYLTACCKLKPKKIAGLLNKKAPTIYTTINRARAKELNTNIRIMKQ